jgi:chitodextrinase
MSAETSPPTAPASLSASAVGENEVDLSWAASTDNVGVAGYRVYRNGTQVATTASTTYADVGLTAATTYTYSVVAFDEAGNSSPASPTATATTAPPALVTLTFNPTDDTYVQDTTATTNYGSATEVVADASPVRHLYLKFNVSGVGSSTVVSAKLRLYCVDPSPFGGNFHRVASTTWTESGINWNTAPAADATSLGTLASVSANKWYEVDVTSVVQADGLVSLEADSTSTDGAYYASKERGAATAPQLVLSVRR